MLETTIQGPRGREHLCLNAQDGRWQYQPEGKHARDLVPVETVARLRERATRDGTRRAVQAVA